MRVDETEMPSGGYEQRYTVKLGTLEMRMVRRPVSITPEEGTVCFVDNGPRVGTIPRAGAGAFKGGRWVSVKFEPTHWTHWEDWDRGQ